VSPFLGKINFWNKVTVPLNLVPELLWPYLVGNRYIRMRQFGGLENWGCARDAVLLVPITAPWRGLQNNPRANGAKAILRLGCEAGAARSPMNQVLEKKRVPGPQRRTSPINWVFFLLGVFVNELEAITTLVFSKATNKQPTKGFKIARANTPSPFGPGFNLVRFLFRGIGQDWAVPVQPRLSSHERRKTQAKMWPCPCAFGKKTTN